MNFKLSAAAVLLATALAPGVASAQNCAFQPDVEACLQTHWVKPTSAAGPALDAFVAAQEAAAKTHSSDKFVLSLYTAGRAPNADPSPVHGNRRAVDVVTEAQLLKLPMPVRYLVTQCVNSGISLAALVHTGCGAFADSQNMQIMPALVLAMLLAQLGEVDPAVRAVITTDAIAAAHRAQLSGLVPPGLLVDTPDATLFARTASQSLRNTPLQREFLPAYLDSLKRELAGRPLHDWRGPAAGAK